MQLNQAVNTIVSCYEQYTFLNFLSNNLNIVSYRSVYRYKILYRYRIIREKPISAQLYCQQIYVRLVAFYSLNIGRVENIIFRHFQLVAGVHRALNCAFWGRHRCHYTAWVIEACITLIGCARKTVYWCTVFTLYLEGLQDRVRVCVIQAVRVQTRPTFA